MSACANGSHCVAYDRNTRTAPWVERCPLCQDCLAVSARDIGRLGDDHDDLAEQLWPMRLGQWRDGQPGISGEAPMPLAGNVDAIRREIIHITTTWEEIVREVCRLADPPPRPDVHRAVTILARHTEALATIGGWTCQLTGCEDPWDEHTGLDAIDTMRWLHRRSLAITGITTDTRHLPGHCQNKRCGRAELLQDNGSDDVRCGHCGKTITRDDYERYGNLFLREAA